MARIRNKSAISSLFLSVTGKSVSRALGVAAAFILIASLAPSAQAQPQSVPVMVGGSPDFDACQTLSRVRGLKRLGDNFLSVRRGPGTGYGELDRLRNGRNVFKCSTRGSWVGIVYSSSGQGDCGVSSPVAQRQAYRGNCRSGWVHKSFLADVAG